MSRVAARRGRVPEPAPVKVIQLHAGGRMKEEKAQLAIVEEQPKPLAKVQPVRTGGIDIEGLKAISALAEQLGECNLLPKHIRSKADCVAVMLTGAELGIPPMMSVRGISMVEGKPVLSYDLLISCVQRAGYSIEWVPVGDDTKEAVLRLTNPAGSAHLETFTWKDAETAGLARKDNWRKYPRAMLRARCASSAIRAFAAEAIGAAVYVTGELADAGMAEERIEPMTAKEMEKHYPPEQAQRIADASERDVAILDEVAPVIKACTDVSELDVALYRHGFKFRQMTSQDPRNGLWRIIKAKADECNAVIREETPQGTRAPIYTRQMISDAIQAAEEDGLTPWEREQGITPETVIEGEVLAEPDEMEIDDRPVWMR